MKKCIHCGAMIADDNARFCLNCGKECEEPQPAQTTINLASNDNDGDTASLVGDKNVISESTIIGRQDKYEASNITIHNNITEDHSHTTIVCAVSGKRIYMDQSVVCPKCGKSVATEYYVEVAKRCENCDNEALAEFRTFAKQTLAGKTFDNTIKALLNEQAQKLLITEEKQMKILREVQSTAKNKEAVLSSVQQAELESAITHFIHANSDNSNADYFGVFQTLHDATQNYIVDFWYYLAFAVSAPEKYIKAYEEELLDNYWQRYWAFLAYCSLGSAKGSSSIDHLRKLYNEKEDDISLAEASYILARGFSSLDTSMTARASSMVAEIKPDYLSKPLLIVYNTIKHITDDGCLTVDDGVYTHEEFFVIWNIFCGEKIITQLLKQRQDDEERARKEAEAKALAEQREREEAERKEQEEKALAAKREREEREAAERERKAKQQAMIADREKRMAEEMARLGAKPAEKGANKDNEGNKAFAGYQTTVPEKKGKTGKIILYVVIAIIVILAILFMIPAPESMQ